MRKTIFALMQAPEGQSAAADGAAPAQTADTAAPAPQVSTDAPAAEPAATEPAASSDVQEQPAATLQEGESTPVPEQAPPAAEDDPMAGLADSVEHLTNIVSSLADQANALAARVDALEQAKADGGLQDEIVKQAQDIMRVAMTNLAKDFADLPAKIRAIEGRLKHF